jgi:drug/metabolite transporter (DMT)-like permease
VTTVSLIAFVTPLVAIVFGVILADEHMTPLIIVGTVLILSGIFLVLKKQRLQPAES